MGSNLVWIAEDQVFALDAELDLLAQSQAIVLPAFVLADFVSPPRASIPFKTVPKLT